MNRTELKQRLFDRARDRQGQSETLQLLSYSPTNGHAVVKTITEGWYGKRVKGEPGTDELEVRLAETEDLTDVFRESITHLNMDSYYYKFIAVTHPTAVTRVWIIRCAPTGTRA